MKVYVYRAALLCGPCAIKVRTSIPLDTINHDDSECWPQGPYSDGGGEADTPQHCDHCGEFLENPLTADGYNYVAEAIDFRTRYGDNRAILREWAEFYKNSLLDNAIQEWQSLKPEDWR